MTTDRAITLPHEARPRRPPACHPETVARLSSRDRPPPVIPSAARDLLLLSALAGADPSLPDSFGWQGSRGGISGEALRDDRTCPADGSGTARGPQVEGDNVESVEKSNGALIAKALFAVKE